MLSRFWGSKPAESERYPDASNRQGNREYRSRTALASESSRRDEPGVAGTTDWNRRLADEPVARRPKQTETGSARVRRNPTLSRTELATRSHQRPSPGADPFLREALSQSQQPHFDRSAESSVKPSPTSVVTHSATDRGKVDDAGKSTNPFATLNRETRHSTPVVKKPVREPGPKTYKPFPATEEDSRRESDGKIATVPSFDDPTERERFSRGFDSELRRLRRSVAASENETVDPYDSDAKQFSGVRSTVAPVAGNTSFRHRRSDSANSAVATKHPKPETSGAPISRQSSMPIVSRGESHSHSTEFSATNARAVGLSTSSTLKPHDVKSSPRNPFTDSSRDNSAPETSQSPFGAVTIPSSINITGRGRSASKTLSSGDRSMIVDSHLVPDRFKRDSVPQREIKQIAEPPKPPELQIVPRTQIRSSKTSKKASLIQQTSAVTVPAVNITKSTSAGEWVPVDQKSPKQPSNPANVEVPTDDDCAPAPPAELAVPEKAAAIETTDAPISDSDAETNTVRESTVVSEEPVINDDDRTAASGSSQAILLSILFAITMVCYCLRRRRAAARVP